MAEAQGNHTNTGPSTELTGGVGFTYEDLVVGYFLAALLRTDPVTGVAGTVVRVAVQQRGAGQPLDDVVVDTEDAVGTRRLSLQVKRSLTISAAPSNGDFRQILADCRATRAERTFRIGRDAYGFVADSVATGPMRNLRRIVELAKASTNGAEFVQRFQSQGATSIKQRELRLRLRGLVAETDDNEWDFYRHLQVPDLRNLEPGGALRAVIESNLDAVLVGGGIGAGTGLFAALCGEARIGAGAGKVWTRPSLLHELVPKFRFRGMPAFAYDLETVGRVTETALAEISDKVGGYHVDRSASVEKVFTLLKTYRLVNITGLPGCGKSAILRNAAERIRPGPVLFLKSDRLSGKDWQEFAVAKGLVNRNPVDLLAEIGSTGSNILFIDGIDRIPPSQRFIVKDLMQAIIDEPALECWRVLVTSRNQGMEPFRVWVPSPLYRERGIGELSVDGFDEDEAERLAEQAPSLQPLLFGSEEVRSIARRPFFASVLAGGDGYGGEGTSARCETDLIRYWWQGGGYNAGDRAILMRQRALLDLARVGGRSIGKAVSAMSLKPETVECLADLIDDGIIRTQDENATYSFTHDIFFEWAYFRLLVGLGDDWNNGLIEIGQPPLLGRVVGLLAQRAIGSGQRWNDGFAQLNNSDLRPQWRRAWVTGPVASPQFHRSKDRFTAVMEADDWSLLRRFLVWFQAEHTIPNPLVLENNQLPIDGMMRVRLADQTGWPGDWVTWGRVILWLISLVDRLPIRLLPLVLELFRVWQNQFAATPNPVSVAILAVCTQWLEEIDTVSYEEKFSFDRGRWNTLHSEALKALESLLRQTVLLAMRAYPNPGNAVLDRAIANERLRSDAYESILPLAPTIAVVSPQKLADLARAELLKPLPKDVIAEEKERQSLWLENLARIRAKPAEQRTEIERRTLNRIGLRTSRNPADNGLRDLAIGEYHRAYFPTSPLHEPFASLFRESPDVARALVRDIGNHATTAWRQIHKIAPRRHGTPIPLDLDFPWGRQRFWGDWNSYNWISDYPAPQPLACAFMALAYWAHKKLESGVSVDDLIRQVVEGHQSFAVLALAGALALERDQASAAILPIATAQRLWKMDMARAAQEPMRGIDLFGFRDLNRLTRDKEAATNYLKSRSSRYREIRSLAPLFALSSDEDLRAAFHERLAQFPADLPYEYEEERGVGSLEARLQEEAKQWAGLGDASNYRASRMPDGERVMVEYESPIPLSDSKRQSVQDAGMSLNEYEIAAWADKSLQAGALDPSSTLETAFAFVKTRDSPTLFDHLTPAGGGMTQSAVSGVAACVLLLGDPSPEDKEWTLDVMRRVEDMGEERRHTGGGNIPWHPAFHLIAMLRADLNKPEMQDNAAKRLFRLCVHPNTKVAHAALATLLNSPKVATAWNATVLASDLWHYFVPILRGSSERDYSQQREAQRTAVSRAVARLANGTMTVPGPLPAPWASRRQRGRATFDEGDFDSEPEQIVSFDYRAAGEIIRAFPIDTFCRSEVYKGPFLTHVKDLVDWTAGQFTPQDETPDLGRPRRREHALLDQWPARLGELLSRIVPYVDVEEMRTNYIGPFLQPDDENGLEVTAHFAESIVYRHVFDGPVITPNAISLLQLCIDQVLADPIFWRGSYRAGEVHGFDRPRMIKALLFVPLDQPAPGAARFANGDWSDLPIVLPLVDKFVGECGWAPYVMDTFLTLAERAGLSYPIDPFLNLMKRVLTELGDNADGWVGTMMPARIAGVIQTLADANYPLSAARATASLHVLDMLIDLGDRRAAALETSETFRATQTD